MADLSSILGGMIQGFKDFGTGLVDMFGTAGAAIGDSIASIQSGKATSKNQDDFRKWLYNTDSVQDAAAKGLGTALNGVSAVADVIPGAQAVTANPLFNGLQGAIGGLSDELKMNGQNADWGKAAQRAGVGAASGLASGYAGDALGKSSNKLLSNGLTRGAVSGALNGSIANAGYTGIEGGSAQDMINSALYGASTGALVGGSTGLARELIKPTYRTDATALTDDEKAARTANIDNQLAELDATTPEGSARYKELTTAKESYSPKNVADLMKEPKQKSVADLMLSPEQKEFFKDSMIRDENGNLKPMYHGTRGDFTVFGHGKTSSTSNSNSSVGYWFTPDENSAKNFADSTWYGEGDPKAMKTYLNIKNPKVYEAVDNSKAIESVTKRLRELELAPNKLSDTDLYYDDMYKASMVQNMVNQGDEDMAVKWLSDKGYSNDRAARLVDEIANIKKVLDEKENLLNEYAELRYGDAYEQFKTDLYKVDGQTAEDANAGGIGMALRDKDSIKKYVDGLKSQGYDGIIIKGTGYDADVMGGPNDQYVVFDPNQIKDVNNLKPTLADDIMASKVAPGQLGLFDQPMPTKKPVETARQQVSLFDQPTTKVRAVDTEQVNPYAPVDGQVTQTMRDRAEEVLKNWKKNGVPENELYSRIDESTIPEKIKNLRELTDKGEYEKITESKLGAKNIEDVPMDVLLDYLYDGDQGRIDRTKWLLEGRPGDGPRANRSKKQLKNRIVEETQRKIDEENELYAKTHENPMNASIRKGYTAAADELLSERLGIAPGNTPKYNGAIDIRNAYGRYRHPGYGEGGNISVFEKKMNGPEDAISTVGHERLHSFQGETASRSNGRYNKEVIDAYNELRKDLGHHYKTYNEIKDRYKTNTSYWLNSGEQESRMFQQYLENRGYADSSHMKEKSRSNEWGNEINPAFDKFIDKLRDLSKRGIALPALAALFGGGALLSNANKKEEEDIK